MEIFKIWDKEIPLFNSEINNVQNEGINTIKFFGIKTEKPAPLVVIYPGGGYGVRCTDVEGIPVAEYFNEKGFNAAVVEYRVAPYRYPAPLIDAQRAIKVLRYNAKKLNINPDKVYTLGFSAGGHLTGMTAIFPDVCNCYNDEIDKMSAKPNGAVLCYPVISADEEIIEHGSFQNLLGDDYCNRQKYSLEKLVDKNTCPCFMFHCREDDIVPVMNSVVMAQSFIKNNIYSELHLYPVGFHGGALRKEFPHSKSWPELAVEWLNNLED